MKRFDIANFLAIVATFLKIRKRSLDLFCEKVTRFFQVPEQEVESFNNNYSGVAFDSRGNCSRDPFKEAKKILSKFAQSPSVKICSFLLMLYFELRI